MNLIVYVKLIPPQQTAFHKSQNFWEAVLSTTICLILKSNLQLMFLKATSGQSKFVLAADKQWQKSCSWKLHLVFYTPSFWGLHGFKMLVVLDISSMRYKHEIFILEVLGFLKTPRSFTKNSRKSPKSSEDVRSIPKTCKVFRSFFTSKIRDREGGIVIYSFISFFT